MKTETCPQRQNTTAADRERQLWHDFLTHRPILFPLPNQQRQNTEGKARADIQKLISVSLTILKTRTVKSYTFCKRLQQCIVQPLYKNRNKCAYVLFPQL